jgi:CheY-like chemotaxis protein
MVAEFMGELLSGWGCNVVVRNDPADAEAWLARDPARVDLVVTDQTMPKLSGIELARRLRALRGDLPIILYTGNADAIGEDERARAGVDALVRKPVEPSALYELVRCHLTAGGA